MFQRESNNKQYQFASTTNADGSVSIFIAEEQASDARSFVDEIHENMDKAEQERKETKAQEDREEILNRARTTQESTDGKPRRKRRIFSRSR
jgi:hypothetical protein